MRSTICRWLCGLLIAASATAGAGSADGGGGGLSAYLAAEHAQAARDPVAALAFYQRALEGDPGSRTLRLRVFTLALGAARFDLAVPLARALVAADPSLPLPTLTLAVEALHDDKPELSLDLAQKLPQTGFFLYVRGFTSAWATLAIRHDPAAAIAALYAGGDVKALGPMMPVQAALMAEMADDRADADKYYAEARSAGATSLRLTQLYGNYAERTGRAKDAAAAYDAFVAAAAPETQLVPHVAVPGPPAALLAKPADGLAEALFQLSGLMGEDAAPEVAQLLIRLSLRLRPDFAQANLILAESLEGMGENVAAIEALRRIEPGSPFAYRARLHEASLLDREGDLAASTKVLKSLQAQSEGQVEATVQLANELREHEKFADAIALYNQALGPGDTAPQRLNWSIHFSRAIAYERSGDWPAAEADLRRALALSPDEPEVLNYLGYALVDRQQRLDEATDLIRRAVSLKPDDGYIVDSLGWALYRQGKTGDAETTLERAVELKPGDAEINDHLGDAYWQGGKGDEARLQWRRALSLNPTPDLAKSITSKIEAHRRTAAGPTGRGG